MKTIPLDHLVSHSLGVSTALGILSAAKWLSANSGCAAMTNALNTLGFGQGMTAGIAVLLSLSACVSQVAQTGFSTLASTAIRTRVKKGDDPDAILQDIAHLSVSEDIKSEMRKQVRDVCTITQD